MARFKSELVGEIESRMKGSKGLLQMKCEETFNSIEKLNEEMHSQLDKDPSTIKEFIEMNIYLEGERI